MVDRADMASAERGPSWAMPIVAAAWRDVLDKRSLAADAPFDDAGGDSLRLATLVVLIERASGLTLPLELCRPTLRPSGFAWLLQRVASTPAHHAPDPPGALYLIPGSSGDSPSLAALRTLCAPALAVIGVETPDLRALVAPELDMEAIAARLAADIALRAAPGPIRLAGYSMGGILACLVAGELHATGRDIAFLGLLDSARTCGWRSRGTWAPGPLREFYWSFFATESATTMAYDLLPDTRASLRARLGYAIGRTLSRPSLRPVLSAFLRLRRGGVITAVAERTATYQLATERMATWQDAGGIVQRLRTRVVIFRAGSHAQRGDDLGWRAIWPDLCVVPVPGTHITMVRPPNAAALAEAIVASVAAEPPVPALRPPATV